MKIIKLSMVAFLTLFLTNVKAQTAEEIAKKHIDAVGGADAWRKISSIRMEGNLTVQGAEVKVVRTVLHGKGAKEEIMVAGMTGYNIITPSGGWSYMPFNGQTQPEPMTEEQLKESQEELDAQDELVDYKEKGSSIELVGKDDVDGTECFKLKLTFKSGKSDYLFIDPKSYLTIRQISKQKANGQEVEVTTNFSNFEKLPEGITIPKSITLPFGELQVTKAEVNVSVDEAIFKPKS